MTLLERYSLDDVRAMIDMPDVTPDEVRALLAGLRAELADGANRYFPGARAEQRAPLDDWAIWLLLAGRGFGKTLSGAEWLVEEAIQWPGNYAVAAPTYGDGRDICIEGPSGVRAVLQRRGIWAGPAMWNRSLGELNLGNGSRFKVGSADEPDRFRGWNFSGSWLDELAAWRRPDAFTQLRLATRIGRARMCVTTTPRPTKLVKLVMERPTTVVVRGSTFDNAVNLSPEFLVEMRSAYEGTRIGRQELYGELLLDTPGALWTQATIDDDRVEEPPALRRVVVAIDPAVTTGENSDSTGLVVAGLGVDGHVYVLADATMRSSPHDWASAAVALLDDWEADRIVAEVNNGGDLVETVIRTVRPNVPYRKVHASRGKRMRAEPVAALYEQHRVHHVGMLADLEDQMCTWTPDSPDSPDRLDALVWAITDLAIEPHKRRMQIVNVG